MKDEIKFNLRMPGEMAAKLDYISEYYGRSRNSEIVWAMKMYISQFERKIGKIELETQKPQKIL